MKKIILTALGMMFIASSAFAASMGISGTALYYDASGMRQLNHQAKQIINLTVVLHQLLQFLLRMSLVQVVL